MIPEDVIKKLQLQHLIKDTVGVSWITGSRIFLWPAMTNKLAVCYVMECHPDGTNLINRTVCVVAKGPRFYKYGYITYEMLQAFTEAKLCHIVRNVVSKGRAKQHYFGRDNPDVTAQKKINGEGL